MRNLLALTALLCALCALWTSAGETAPTAGPKETEAPKVFEAAAVDAKVVRAIYGKLTAGAAAQPGLLANRRVETDGRSPWRRRRLVMASTFEYPQPPQGDLQDLVIKRTFAGYLRADEVVQRVQADGKVSETVRIYVLSSDGRLLGVEHSSATGGLGMDGRVQVPESGRKIERRDPKLEKAAWDALSRDLLLLGPSVEI